MKAKQVCEQALLKAAYFADVLHVREEGSNRGRWVEEFQKFGGVAKGTAWCASFLMYTLGAAGWPETFMPPAADWSRGTVCSIVEYYLKKGVPITSDLSKVTRGCAFAWCNRKTWHGHIGWVCEVDEEDNQFRTIEGNSRDRVDRRWRSMEEHTFLFIRFPEATL